MVLLLHFCLMYCLNVLHSSSFTFKSLISCGINCYIRQETEVKARSQCLLTFEGRQFCNPRHLFLDLSWVPQTWPSSHASNICRILPTDMGTGLRHNLWSLETFVYTDLAPRALENSAWDNRRTQRRSRIPGQARRDAKSEECPDKRQLPWETWSQELKWGKGREDSERAEGTRRTRHIVVDGVVWADPLPRSWRSHVPFLLLFAGLLSVRVQLPPALSWICSR